ncbi:MAG: hypothetical protein IPJ30_20860 [Acidobacteria bacterium]|nr:hypothetical protein [Acidobacteriota bacterium]
MKGSTGIARIPQMAVMPATVYDIFRGTLSSVNYRQHQAGRSARPCSFADTDGCDGAKAFPAYEARFDIRGLFPEEYTDAGVWPADGWLYRSAKAVSERWLLRESDGFVSPDRERRQILFPERRDLKVKADGSPDLSTTRPRRIQNPKSKIKITW